MQRSKRVKMTARVGIARTMSGAILALQQIGADVKTVSVTQIGVATCRNALLMAQSYYSGTAARYRIIQFAVRAPADKMQSQCCRPRRLKRPTELFAYAALLDG